MPDIYYKRYDVKELLLTKIPCGIGQQVKLWGLFQFAMENSRRSSCNEKTFYSIVYDISAVFVCVEKQFKIMVCSSYVYLSLALKVFSSSLVFGIYSLLKCLK